MSLFLAKYKTVLFLSPVKDVCMWIVLLNFQFSSRITGNFFYKYFVYDFW